MPRLRPLIFLLLPATAAVAAPAAFDPARLAIPFQKFTLDNGLTLIVHEDHNVPIVAVNLWYHVGSRNERPGRTGFAHLFEHFFFNGSENHPHGFREAMDALGATNRNGTTSTDRTNFFEDVPVSALERTLHLEADRMGYLAGRITAESLERERGVVQNEKRQRENEPYGRVYGTMVPVLYPAAHPYSWTVIGSMEDLAAASLDDVKEWYRTYYGPNNCVIALAGDITPARALELVRKYFDGIPPGPPLARAQQWVPRFERNVRAHMQDRVPQARIYRVYHVPGWTHADLPLVHLFGGVLAGSKSARLDRRLVYEKELATEVAYDLDDAELSSTLSVAVTVKPGVSPADAERELDAVMAELLRTGPTAAELLRARSRELGGFVRRLERLGGFGGRSDVLAESMTFGGRPDAYLARLEGLADATTADVREAATRWIDAPHYTLVVEPYPPLKPGKTSVDRKVLPPVGTAAAAGFPALQRAALANGLKVLLLERHGTPLVNAALAVDAGNAADSPEKAGAASLALELLEEGTATRDGFRIVDELDALGARILTDSGRDLSYVRLRAPSANLGPALELFADVSLHPAFPADKFAVRKRRRLARIAQEKGEPFAAAARIVSPILYGPGHAYANPQTGSGYASTVEALTRDDMAAWHAAWFRPGSSTLIVTGDVTLAQLLPQVERAFGGWKAGELPAKNVAPVAPPAARQVYLVDRPAATQSMIVAAHVSEPGGRPDDLAIETGMRLFGGMATSRLNRNLRLDKHWSYGTTGTLGEARGPRPFVVYAPVQTDKTKEAILEIAKEIRGFAGERPVAGEEFETLMRQSTARLPGRFETLADLELAAARLVNFGYADDYWAKYADNLRDLTEASLADAARAYVRPDALVWIVIGDLAKVEAGIRELALGDVVHVDGDGRPVR